MHYIVYYFSLKIESIITSRNSTDVFFHVKWAFTFPMHESKRGPELSFQDIKTSRNMNVHCTTLASMYLILQSIISIMSSLLTRKTYQAKLPGYGHHKKHRNSPQAKIKDARMHLLLTFLCLLCFENWNCFCLFLAGYHPLIVPLPSHIHTTRKTIVWCVLIVDHQKLMLVQQLLIVPMLASPLKTPKLGKSRVLHTSKKYI